MDDELERRLAALELLAIEGMAWHAPEVLADVAASIRNGMHNVDDDERMVRNQALGLIDDALRRFKMFGPAG